MDLGIAALLVVGVVFIAAMLVGGAALLVRAFSHPEHPHVEMHKKVKHGTLQFHR